jgi:HEAT repeat protein
MALAQSQHIIKIEYWPAEDWNFAAQEEFSVLGTNAQSAVPALIEIVNQNISRHSQISAVEALGNIGPSAKEAVPALLGWTTNGDWLVRFSAIESLGKVGAEPDRVVPVLLNAFLHDPDVKIVAATALGEFGANAKPAVPALLEYFSAPDAATNRIANALKAIDPEAAAKAGVK